MSRLLCTCGHVIHDHTSGLPYKASILKSVNQEDFFDWMTSEIQSYCVAAQAGEIKQWLLERRYGNDYFELGLDHGNVLHDHIHAHYLAKKRDMYECEKCGRIHIEKSDNQFVAYSPSSRNSSE